MCIYKTQVDQVIDEQEVVNPLEDCAIYMTLFLHALNPIIKTTKPRKFYTVL